MKFIILLLIFIFTSVAETQSGELLEYQKLASYPISRLMEEGENFQKTNRTDTALGYYVIIVSKYNPMIDTHDKKICVRACVLMGLLYYEKGLYSKAFDTYMKGIRICEDNGFYNLLPELYKNIGNIYGVFNDFAAGIENQEKALRLVEKYPEGNDEVKVKLLMNLAGMCSYNSQVDKAKKYYEEMMKYKEKDSLVEYFYYLNKGLICDVEGKYDSAIMCIKNSISYAEKEKLPVKYICASYSNLVNIYDKKGMTDSTLYYLHLTEKMTETDELKYINMPILEALAKIYKLKNNTEKWNYYRMKYLTDADSLFNNNEFNRMKSNQLVYEFDKNARKIEQLSKEKYENEQKVRQQTITIAVICAVTLLIFVLLVMVYLEKRKLKVSYNDLYRKNKDLLEMEKVQRGIRAEYETQIEEQKQQIQKMAEELSYKKKQEEVPTGVNEAPAPAADENTTCNEEDDEHKNSAYRITEEQRRTILFDINRVMEDTDTICDSEFGLEKLASIINSNSKYVSQVINETYQKNFRAFLNEYRIKEAQLRLMDNDRYANYTIKAIAESVGYKSQANFTELFKKATGITPYMFQKIASEEKNRFSAN